MGRVMRYEKGGVWVLSGIGFLRVDNSMTDALRYAVERRDIEAWGHDWLIYGNDKITPRAWIGGYTKKNGPY